MENTPQLVRNSRPGAKESQIGLTVHSFVARDVDPQMPERCNKSSQASGPYLIFVTLHSLQPPQAAAPRPAAAVVAAAAAAAAARRAA